MFFDRGVDPLLLSCSQRSAKRGGMQENSNGANMEQGLALRIRSKKRFSEFVPSGSHTVEREFMNFFCALSL